MPGSQPLQCSDHWYPGRHIDVKGLRQVAGQMANIQELCLADIPFTDDPFYPLDLSKLQHLKSLDLRQVQAG